MAEIIKEVFIAMHGCFSPSPGYTNEDLQELEKEILSFESFESVYDDKKNMSSDNKNIVSDFKSSMSHFKSLLV